KRQTFFQMVIDQKFACYPPKRTRKRPPRRLDRRHSTPQRSCLSGYFRADNSHPDNHNMLGPVEIISEQHRIVICSEIANPFQLGTWYVQPSDRGASTKNHLIGRQLRPVNLDESAA